MNIRIIGGAKVRRKLRALAPIIAADVEYYMREGMRHMHGKRQHTSKRRPVVKIMTYPDGRGVRFYLSRFSRNGKITRHGVSYANTQAAHRAARRFFPGIRVERVS